MYIKRKYFTTPKNKNVELENQGEISSSSLSYPDKKQQQQALAGIAGVMGAHHILDKSGSLLSKKLDQEFELLRKNGFNEHESELVRKLKNEINKRGINLEVDPNGSIGSFNSGSKTITIRPRSPLNVVAHELGHAHYHHGGSKNIIARAAHKGYRTSKRITGSNMMPVGAVMNGFHSGMIKEKNKAEGKKTNAFDKYKSVALPLAISSPVLVAEAAASIKGQRILKGLGANKKLLRKGAKQNLLAYGTYLMNPIKHASYGAAGELVGRSVGKAEYNNKNKEL